MIQNIWEIKGFIAREVQRRRAQTTEFLLDLKLGDLVLDIGCGEGFVTSYMLKASLVVGLDLSTNSILIAKKNIKSNNIDFICAYLSELPFKGESFNKASILEVLEHLKEEQQRKMCMQLDRVLRRRGVLVISVPYKEKVRYIHCTPLFGHLHSMDEKKVSNLLGNNYKLVATCNLINVALVSCFFKLFPFRLWFLLNILLEKLRKGYWVLLKYNRIK